MSPGKALERAVAVGLVAGFPPPGAGMTVQAETLRRRLTEDGLVVKAVRTNPQLTGPLRPLQRVRFVRGAIAWARYAWALRALPATDIVHVFASSGLSFFLFVAPAVAVGRVLRRPVVMHYHGGAAATFLDRWGWLAAPFVRAADRVVVPSGFLVDVFARHGIAAVTIANPVDVPSVDAAPGEPPVVLSCRNLTPIYDIATAIDAFARLVAVVPAARLLVAGDGPDRSALERQADAIGLADRVEFLGNVDPDDMATVRARATLLINTSRVDNQPVSLLEALAAGLPVVSTDAGGIPDMVSHDVDALLAPVGNADALGAHLSSLAQDDTLAERLRAAGRVRARAFRWEAVRSAWFRLYGDLLQQEVRGRFTSLRPTGEDGVRS